MYGETVSEFNVFVVCFGGLGVAWALVLMYEGRERRRKEKQR